MISTFLFCASALVYQQQEPVLNNVFFLGGAYGLPVASMLISEGGGG